MQKNEVMNDFKRLCEIPHCSCETEQMREFLADFARCQGFNVNVDEAGNIHAVKGEPKICLQSHYDMVCVGAAPHLELIEEDGILRAKNSSLGADDGRYAGVCEFRVLIYQRRRGRARGRKRI